MWHRNNNRGGGGHFARGQTNIYIWRKADRGTEKRQESVGNGRRKGRPGNARSRGDKTSSFSASLGIEAKTNGRTRPHGGRKNSERTVAGTKEGVVGGKSRKNNNPEIFERKGSRIFLGSGNLRYRQRDNNMITPKSEEAGIRGTLNRLGKVDQMKMGVGIYGKKWKRELESTAKNEKRVEDGTSNLLRKE